MRRLQLFFRLPRFVGTRLASSGKQIRRTTQALPLLMLMLLSLTSITHAQTGLWSAWLMRGDGRMLLVNDTGLVEEFILPLTGGYDAYLLPEIAVAPSGMMMAYIAGKSTAADQQLQIYDHSTRATIGVYELSSVGGVYGGLPAFSPDSRLLAFGYALASPDWEMIIVDLSNMTITQDIRSDSSAAFGKNIPYGAPYIQSYEAGRIAFTQITQPLNPQTLYQSFVWDTLLNDLEPTQAHRSLNDDVYRPTGEVVLPMDDSRFPGDTLQVFNPATQTIFPVYNDPVSTLVNPHFALNGAQLVFSSINPDLTSQQWVIDRQGAVIGSLATAVSDLAGTPEGFIYTSGSAVYSVNTTSGISEPTLIYDSGVAGDLSIVWVGSPGGLPIFSAGNYPAWGQLAPPVADGSGQVVPVFPIITPTPEPAVLREGGTAVVNTTSGDSLNLRTDAGVAFQIRKKLPRGTELTILAGPVEANGFNWWQVREPEGLEGWVVDYVDGVQTLVPRAVFDGIAEVGERSANPEMESLLQVGDVAEVTLSDPDDILRMRNGAGLNFRVIALLPVKTRVTIVDGPRVADSLTWWQIRTADGSAGWAAEIIGSERALTRLDTALIPTATPLNPGAMIPPLLVSPLDGVTLTSLGVEFRWSPVPGAATYTLTIEQCADTCQPLATHDNLTTNTFPIAFDQAGSYRWQLTAFDTNGANSSTSDWWTFELKP